MNYQLQQNSSALLTCFFSECESAFSFLELEHGYSYLSGLVDYRQGRQIITPYHGQKIEGSFRAAARYETEDRAIEISYDSEDFLIETYIYANHIHRLSPSDILKSAKKNDPDVKDSWWVTEQSHVEKTIRNITDALKNNTQTLLSPDQRIIERALTMRSKRIEQAVRAQYKRDLEYVSKLAAKAFLKKDYQRVIELLYPLERDLGSADKKKLALAQKYLLSGS